MRLINTYIWVNCWNMLIQLVRTYNLSLESCVQFSLPMWGSCCRRYVNTYIIYLWFWKHVPTMKTSTHTKWPTVSVVKPKLKIMEEIQSKQKRTREKGSPKAKIVRWHLVACTTTSSIGILKLHTKYSRCGWLRLGLHIISYEWGWHFLWGIPTRLYILGIFPCKIK